MPSAEKWKVASLSKAFLRKLTAVLTDKLQRKMDESKKDIEELKEQGEEPVEDAKPGEEAQKTAELLASTNELEFVEKDDHHEDVKWLVGLFLYLTGKKSLVDLASPEHTWKSAKSFLADTATAGGIESLILSKPLHFSGEEINELRRYVNGKEERLESQHYTELNAIAGLLAPFVKEAAEAAGAVNPKPWHKVKEAKFAAEVCERDKGKVAEFVQTMKLII